MKIVQFIASSGWGGAEKIFLDLCNEQIKQNEITVITYNNPIIVEHLDPRIRTIIVPKASRNSIRTYWHLYRALRSGPFEIVHTHCAKASEIVYKLSRFWPIKQVATKHNPRKAKIFDKIPRIAAVSNAVAASLPARAQVIFNGISPQACPAHDQRTARFSMVAIGRLDPIKGFDQLIEQVAKLSFEFTLDILGEGPQRAMLQHKINQLGLQDHVKLRNHQTDIPERMSQADLTIISSHSEGFSLVAIEALFYANVLLSSPVGITTDLLDDALLSDPSDLAKKITAIAKNYEWAQDHFREIKDRNRDRFLIENTAKSYQTFYRSTP